MTLSDRSGGKPLRLAATQILDCSINHSQCHALLWPKCLHRPQPVVSSGAQYSRSQRYPIPSSDEALHTPWCSTTWRACPCPRGIAFPACCPGRNACCLCQHALPVWGGESARARHKRLPSVRSRTGRRGVRLRRWQDGSRMFRSGFFEIGEWLVRPVGGLCEVPAIATDPERSRVVDHRLVGVTVCEVKSCDSRHVCVAL